MVMAYTAQQRLRDNLAALSTALTIREHVRPSTEDLAALSQYAGFGGIKPVLYGEGNPEDWLSQGATREDLRLHVGMTEFYALLREHLDGPAYTRTLESLKNSSVSAFYTPAFVPRALYAALGDTGLSPAHLYEPSAGAGIFATAAAAAFPNMKQITAVEKDELTGRVLRPLLAGSLCPAGVQIRGFEDTPKEENGTCDLIDSNIPFGNYRVYDRDYPGMTIAGRIHTYFFAKALDKLADGGLLAFLTTDAFLHAPANREAREHVLGRSNLVALVQLPANLMKANAGVEVSTHLLLLQKDSQKTRLSADDRLLANTLDMTNAAGSYSVNAYAEAHPETLLGDKIREETNAYGQPGCTASLNSYKLNLKIK